MPRIIAHLDMDSFFASIEERDKPRLRGKPIVVGADPMNGRGRGVVSTANYAARKYGIRSAMPITKAWQYAEDARKRGEEPTAFLGVDMEKYVEESRRVMGIVRERLAKAATATGAYGESSAQAPLMEEASVDEAYLDLSFAETFECARDIARVIKNDIKEREQLTASIGIGPSKLVAKIASDREKPDGLTVVQEEEVEAFLEPLSIRTIPGVGPKTEEQFARMKIKTVRDAKQLSREELAELLGKWGSELYRKLRGQDDAPLIAAWTPKSVGEQETFANDIPIATTQDRKLLTDALAALAREVASRFAADVRAVAGREDAFTSFRRITLTVRFADFTTKNRSVTLAKSVPAGPQALKALSFQGLRLFMPFLDRRENPGRQAIRLLGIRVERLE